MVFKAKYFLGSNFLEAKLGHRPSYTWKSIWGAKRLLEGGLGMDRTINVTDEGEGLYWSLERNG